MTAEWSEQPASGNLAKGPGPILAEQRVALGWSVEQVANQLKLAVRQVVAIEASDYASLPPAAVVRGFVRAYAKVMRLDPTPLVAMVPLDNPVITDSVAGAARREKAASMSQVRFSSSGARRRLPWGLIGGAVAVLASGVAAWQLAPLLGSFGFGAQSDNTEANTVLAPAAQNGSVTELPSPVAGVVAPLDARGKPASAVGPLQDPAVPLISVPPQSQASTPGAGAVSAPVAAPVSAPAAGADALVLTVQEDSWVEVRRAKGRPLLSKMLKAGSTETVQITEPVTLIVGKPDGVKATLRGTALPLPANASGAVARVALQ